MMNTARRTADPDAPDAVTLLKKDHAEVKALFAQALADGVTPAARRKLFEQIAAALELHTKIEETIFYPAFKAKTKAKTPDRDEVMEAYEEHASAKDLIRKLKRTEPGDESYKAKLTVLKEMIEHHVEEEESEMFPESEQLLGSDALHELGARLQAAKDRALGTGTTPKTRASTSRKKAPTRAARRTSRR